MNSKTIKLISTKKYELGLFELPNGQYVVMYELNDGKVTISENIQQYSAASYLFDIKLEELEKHPNVH